jgi:O-antigen ligase
MDRGRGYLPSSATDSPWRSFQAVAIVAFLALYLTKGDMFLAKRYLPGFSPSVVFTGVTSVWLFALAWASGWAPAYARTLRNAGSVLLPFVLLALISLWAVMARSDVVPSQLQPLFFPWLDLTVFGIALALGGSVVPHSVWRSGLWLAFAATVISIGIDVIAPGTFSEVPARAAGLAQNPNGGALVIVLLTAALLPWEGPKWSKGVVFMMLLGAMAVLVTISRAGMLLWILLLARYLVIVPKRADSARRSVLALSALVLAVIVGILVPGRFGLIPMFNIPSNRTQLILGEGGRVVGMATDERLEAIRRSVQLIERAPWFGDGSGTAYEMIVGPHNMYLARWVDNGAVGLAAYLWLLGALLALSYRTRSREAQALAWIMVIFGLFSHNVLEDRTLLLLLGGALGRAVHQGLDWYHPDVEFGEGL